MMAGNPRKFTFYIIHEKRLKGKWEKMEKMKIQQLVYFSKREIVGNDHEILKK